MKTRRNATQKSFFANPFLAVFSRLFCAVFSVSVLFLIPLLLSGCAAVPEAYQTTQIAFGTIISEKIYTTANKEEADAFFAQINDLLSGLEEEVFSWRIEGSEVAKVNAAAGSAKGVEISEKLSAWIGRCLAFSKDCDGAFDIAIGALTRLWDMDALSEASNVTATDLPTAEEIGEALACCGYENISLEGNSITLQEGVSLDLGGAAKGFALEEILSILEETDEITAAVFSLGGDVLTFGTKPDGSAWQVGITDPADSENTLATISLTGTNRIFTSGDYERYVEVDGVRYHHILDPATGLPADSGLCSVTIVLTQDASSKAATAQSDGASETVNDNQSLAVGDAQSLAVGDALCTSCFVLGLKDGMALAAAYGAEAIFITDAGIIYYTSGIAFSTKSSGYTYVLYQ